MERAITHYIQQAFENVIEENQKKKIKILEIKSVESTALWNI